jgi:hypothetical protein
MPLTKIHVGICTYELSVCDHTVIKITKKKFICKTDGDIQVLAIWEISVLDVGWCELIWTLYLEIV